MGRMARRVLGIAAIAASALTPLVGVAAPDPRDGGSAPPRPELRAPSAEETRPSAERARERSAVELIVLTLTCALAVALYSATSGERRRMRVPARVRRR